MLGRPRYTYIGWGKGLAFPLIILVKPRNLKKKSWQNNDVAKNVMYVLIILFDTLISSLATDYINSWVCSFRKC